MISQLLLYIFLTAVTSAVCNEKILSHMILDNTSRLEIPSTISTLIFNEVTFLSSTCELMPNIRELKMIQLEKSTTQRFCLNPSVEGFFIRRSNISAVMIAQSESFNTNSIAMIECPIASIPHNISSLTKLRTLQITGANLQRVNLSILNKLNNLADLTMKGCNISDVYADVPTELSSLVRITLSYNSIKHIDIHRWNMPKLKSFDLSNNHLSEFPSLNRFPDLTEGLLSNNFINIVNMSLVSGMENLSKLELSNNRILHLDSSEPIQLPALSSFDISRNFLQSLNLSTWDVASLTDLYLAYNLLHGIDGIESVADSVEKIHVSGNRWTCVWLKNVTIKLKANWSDDCSFE